MASGILEGVRVVELATGLAGPVAGLMLAELGADVVKVEPPGGDPARQRAAFATWNRSKRSMALDPAESAGRDRLRALLGEADVLIHQFPPSRAAALGLDDATLAAAFPELIVCSVLGYPVGHRDCERPADELLVQARSGFMDEHVGWRAGPTPLRFPAGGWGAAHLAAAGVLTRLIMRLRNGKGGAVHTSLLQGILAVLSLMWERGRAGGLETPRPRPAAASQNSLYQCGDDVWLQYLEPTGRIDVTAIPAIRAAGDALGLDPLEADYMARIFRTGLHTQWIAALQSGDVSAEPLTAMGGALDHADAAANGYVVEVEDPVWGKTRQAAVPIQTEPPVRVRGPAPGLDAHRDAPWPTPRAPRPRIAWPAAEGAAPLAGLKVLDLGAFLAGPFAPCLLADFGADVIKIEPPDGDRMRFMVRFFQACQRNKRSLAIDLGKPEGQEALSRLVKWADVVHHNMRMRAATKLGIDEASLRRHNPDIVFAYASAYGQMGARGNWPGYDTIFQAVGGWEVENAGDGNPPHTSPFGSMDVNCALNSLVGALAAIYRHLLTGEGVTTASSLLGVACFTQSETLIREDGSVAPYPKLRGDENGLGDHHRIFQARDGWVAVAALEPGQPAALRAAFGAVSDAGLEAAARRQGCDELIAKLEAAGVPAEIVLTGAPDRFLDDAAQKASGVIVDYAHPEFGWLEQPGAYVTFGAAPLRFDRHAPLLGQHTGEILREFGYSSEQLAALKAAGAAHFDEMTGEPALA